MLHITKEKFDAIERIATETGKLERGCRQLEKVKATEMSRLILRHAVTASNPPRTYHIVYKCRVNLGNKRYSDMADSIQTILVGKTDLVKETEKSIIITSSPYRTDRISKSKILAYVW